MQRKRATTVNLASVQQPSSSLASDLDLPMRLSTKELWPLLLATFSLLPPPAVAQLGGENVRGDYGMKSGSQGPPGFYLGVIFYFYRTDTVKDLDGNDLSKAPAV